MFATEALRFLLKEEPPTPSCQKTSGRGKSYSLHFTTSSSPRPSPAPRLVFSGANLQRSCDNVSPYGIPPLICGRPFKEAVAAPSLLTGLGLDSSKRLMCSRQRPRGRRPSSKQHLPPITGVSHADISLFWIFLLSIRPGRGNQPSVGRPCVSDQLCT